MSIKIRPYKRRGKKGEGWEVDLSVQRPDGERIRERVLCSLPGKSAANRWAEQRAAHLMAHGKTEPAQAKEVPILSVFKERFISDHCRAERQKPSGIASKETIFDIHLIPRFGNKRLDAISDEDVQRLKA